MNKTFIVVESGACYHLVMLRLDWAVKSVHDILHLELDSGENLGWYTWLDKHLKAYPKVHCQIYVGSMGLQLFEQPI